MNNYGPTIGACWLAFFVIWFALAARTGTGRNSSLEPARGVRVLLAALIAVGIVLGQRLPVLSFGRYTGAVGGAGSCSASWALRLPRGRA
jgi:hypothetical protein